MKQTLLATAVFAVMISGCNTTAQTTSDLCKPLTYQCHSALKKYYAGSKVGEKAAKALTLVSKGLTEQAIEHLESTHTTNAYDQAVIARLLASVHFQQDNYLQALEAIRIVIASPEINANELKSALLLELELLYRLQEFNEIPLKAKAYLAYTEQSQDTKLYTLLSLVNGSDELELNLLEVFGEGHALSKDKQYEDFLKTSSKESTLASVNDKHSPKLKRRVDPSYPIRAIEKKIAYAKVNYIFDLDETGRPRNIKVLDASPDSTFNKAGMKALKQWRYYVSLDKNNQVIDGKGVTVTLEWMLQ